MSRLEDEYHSLLLATRIPPPEREYPFALDFGRKWRADFAWPALKLAVEVQGISWQARHKGKHASPGGFERECEKRNAYNVLGWTLLEFTNKQVTSGEAVFYTCEAWALITRAQTEAWNEDEALDVVGDLLHPGRRRSPRPTLRPRTRARGTRTP